MDRHGSERLIDERHLADRDRIVSERVSERWFRLFRWMGGSGGCHPDGALTTTTGLPVESCTRKLSAIVPFFECRQQWIACPSLLMTLSITS